MIEAIEDVHPEDCGCRECSSVFSNMFTYHIQEFSRRNKCSPSDALLQYFVFCSEELAHLAPDIMIVSHEIMKSRIKEEITLEQLSSLLQKQRKFILERYQLQVGDLPIH